MKMDIVESFEKRIKSRFSHRSELLYDLNLNRFQEIIRLVLQQKSDNAFEPKVKEAYSKIDELLQSGCVEDVLNESLQNGKGYDHMAQ